MNTLGTYLTTMTRLEAQVPDRWPTLSVYKTGVDFGVRLEIVGASRNIHGGIYLTRQQQSWVPTGMVGSAGTPVGDRLKARNFADELTQICDAMDYCIQTLEGIRIED